VRDQASVEPEIEGRFKGRLGAFRLEAAFTIPAAGVTALFGPSGSGKTTLLRCIAGLQRMDGRLSFRGELWQDGRRFAPPHRRPIGYVFQEPSLLPHLSVEANLLFGFRRAKAPQISLDEIAPLLGLDPLLGRSTVRLSGGERQRVAIGRALLAQPQLLLMDEPLSGLDAEAKSEILACLEAVRRTLSIPVIYVSHSVGEVARLADRVLVMRAGRIEPPGQPGAPVGAGEGEEALAGMDEQRVRALALAALRAGLRPEVSPPPE
jgi:molybdate transport system ATP-binding protein